MNAHRNAFIALGSNLGDRDYNLRFATKEIEKRIGEILSVSSFHNTKALNPAELDSQPDFLNAVLHCKTSLEPTRILELLLEIETTVGRIRANEFRWGPRVIDLDLLLVDHHVLKNDTLTLPHPEMHRRDFVLTPLLEIAPDTIHPVLKLSVQELIEQITDSTRFPETS